MQNVRKAAEIRSRIAQLSPRQRECLSLAATPMTSKEIARELGSSPKTVETHLAAVVTKLGVANRREAIRLWQCHQTSGEIPRDEIRLPDSYDLLQLTDAVLDTGLEDPDFHSASFGSGPAAWMKGPNPNDLTLTGRLLYLAAATIISGLAIALCISAVSLLYRAFSNFGFAIAP